MKTNLYIILTLTFFALLFPLNEISAQSNSLDALKANPFYEVRISKDSIAEIYNKETNLRYYLNIKKLDEPMNTKSADLIIDLDTLNLANYSYLYRRWGRIDAADPTSDAKYISIDANKNGKNEIYANCPSDTAFSANIYENISDSLFSLHSIISTDTVNPIYDIGDITNNGLYDIVMRNSNNNMLFYTQDSSNGYIDKPNFIYHPFPYYCQPNDVTFYDLDNDGVQEIIYYLVNGIDSVWGCSNHVARYNPAINNYELIYYHRFYPQWFTFGYATGDFDNDGKNNFSTGGIDGDYYFFEYVTGNNIKVEYQMQLDTYNAFQSLMTNDMNGDGKKEIWVGSQFFDSQYGAVTRVYVFEPSGNESYNIIYRIDIRGLFSSTYGRMRYADMDGDGVKEVFFNNSLLCFCFKYSPQRNFYLDFIINIWEDTPGYTYDEFEGGDIADLDGDGIPEIILQKSLGTPFMYKSLFWKRTAITGVKNDKNPVPGEFKLYQNYPNPFNPSTTIKFSLPEEAKVNIKIYDILGKEITELLNGTRRSGEYEITWNGRDSNGKELPSGVYFITLTTENYRKTIKSLLIK